MTHTNSSLAFDEEEIDEFSPFNLELHICNNKTMQAKSTITEINEFSQAIKVTGHIVVSF